LNEERAKRNIERMAGKAEASGVRFRPHFKTHQSAEVGEWFKQVGVDSITVSSVDMAAYFSANGWEDITIAFSVNIRAMERIDELAAKISLGLLVESDETVEFLNKNLKYRVDLWVDVDVGYGRTGADWHDTRKVLSLAEKVKHSEVLSFAGVLTHAGHSYEVKSVDEIRGIFFDSVSKMSSLRDELAAKGFGDAEISVGDTPTCSVVDDFSGVDEIRPGTFVFYDAKQLQLGCCNQDDIAIALCCPVAAKHEERNEIVVHGGAVHLSKDYLTDSRGIRVYGRVCLPEKKSWGSIIKNAYVSFLSQEHGIVKADEAFLRSVHVGDVLMVLPVHSCLTVDAMREFLTLDGRMLKTMPKFW
jgi:D-serine deaminase-like pyridoxal phosphate-dependent protein